MAREMALAGVNPEELAPPPPPKKPKTAKEKWENYWYHYKWPTIGVLLALIIVGWLVFQWVTANPADYEAVVVTELPLTSEEKTGLEAYLAAAGEDLDGDGTVEVSIENLNPVFYDEYAPTVGRSDMEKLTSYLATGDRMLFVFDAVSYEGFCKTIQNVTEEGYVFYAPLSTTDLDYNADGHYWDWKNDLRREQPLTDTLPESLYFGVRAAEGTAERSQTIYEQGRALLENLISQREPKPHQSLQ